MRPLTKNLTFASEDNIVNKVNSDHKIDRAKPLIIF